MVNKSLEEGAVPDSLKLAKVIPIYKAKDKSDFSNYRPISLLPTISKILEKIVHKRTYHFLKTSDIFYKSQYGFREKHSTIHAVSEFINDVNYSLENKETTLSVFLDLSKAFDTINHNILLKKLEFYGIRGQPLKWFNSYMTNRTQYTQYDKCVSGRQNLTCGVPQGSVLGPLLFIIYTNDLPCCLQNSKGILFADDTTVYSSNKNLRDLYKYLNDDLKCLNDWFMANKLSLNVNKTNCMLFSNTRSVINEEYKLRIGNDKIEQQSCVKFLGVFIDDKLNWHEHINNCKSKLSSAIYAINRVKRLVPDTVLKTLYYSLVYSHLSYGIILWGSTYATHINKLVTMQKKIVRAISNAEYNEHAHPFFLELNLLKLNDIYTIEMAKFMYKYVNKDLPEPLSNIFVNTHHIHDHNTRQSTFMRPFKSRLNTTFNSVLSKGPRIWNALPVGLQNKTNLTSFMSSLKKTIFQNYTCIV